MSHIVTNHLILVVIRITIWLQEFLTECLPLWDSVEAQSYASSCLVGGLRSPNASSSSFVVDAAT